ncbi:MAG: DUF4065 domain-containing protein [Xanthomonadales bacterium]|nr:DUF4065 domain-containing protein [Xanthomonadales bacterium]
MSSSICVADEMLKIAKEKGKTLTPLQLMKLVYVSHGWALAMLGQGLFEDRIEAWKYGPVIPELYQAIKAYGRDPIPLGNIQSDSNNKVPEHIKSFLRSVYKSYGHLSGIDLSNLTHLPGTPWEKVYEQGTRNAQIYDEAIMQHYRILLRRSQNKAA